METMTIYLEAPVSEEIPLDFYNIPQIIKQHIKPLKKEIWLEDMEFIEYISRYGVMAVGVPEPSIRCFIELTLRCVLPTHYSVGAYLHYGMNEHKDYGAIMSFHLDRKDDKGIELQANYLDGSPLSRATQEDVKEFMRDTEAAFRSICVELKENAPKFYMTEAEINDVLARCDFTKREEKIILYHKNDIPHKVIAKEIGYQSATVADKVCKMRKKIKETTSEKVALYMLPLRRRRRPSASPG